MIMNTKKNQTKDDGTLALGIDFGTCRISSAIWNKNKKGPQLVKDMKSQSNKIYIPAILSFGEKEKKTRI
jgi:Ethanolamine utilization protein EutJ (predicted chaperonin)